MIGKSGAAALCGNYSGQFRRPSRIWLGSHASGSKQHRPGAKIPFYWSFCLVRQYRLFIQQNPSHPALAEAHYKIGFYLSYAASPEESIAEYEKAVQLQPGAEIAIEAKEGIAALRYFQGRYEDAQNLFHEIMRETEDWATFKESAHRFKEMTHLVAVQKLPVKRSALDCGPRALEYACNQMGVRDASAKLKSLYEARGNGISLKQLRDAANRAGLRAWGVKVKREQVLFAGAVAGLAGLDQINLSVPRSLLGRGEVDVLIVADGKIANALQVNIGPIRSP